MSESINLLKNKEKKSEDKQAAAKIKIFRYSSLIILFLVSVSAMTLFFLIAFSPLPALEENEAKEMATISNYHSTIAKIHVTKERLGKVEKLLKDRPAYDKTLLLISSVLPSGVSLGDISIKREEIIFSVNSASLQSLDQVSNALIDKVNKKDQLKSLALTGIAPDVDTDSFVMTFTVTLL